MIRLALLVWLLAAPAWAGYLGCYEPGQTVQLPATFLLGPTSTAATSKAAYVYRPDGTLDTTVADGTFVQINAATQPGEYRAPYTLSSTAATGRWSASYRGTMASTVYDSGERDAFDVKPICWTPNKVYTVLADAGNTVLTFKTDIPYTLNIPGGTALSQRWVITFLAVPVCNLAGLVPTVESFVAATDFLVMEDALPAVPDTGCQFLVSN